jgi:aminoglycoside phosphotransferase (APT) family kinase protein
MGRVHGEWLGRDRAVQTLLGGRFDAADAFDAQPLWRALSAYAHPRLCAWIGAEGARLQSELAQQAAVWLAAHPGHPRTLIHNDFNPRNCVVGAETFLRAFDWELAEFGLPQRDAIEMLCFVMPPNAGAHGIRRRIERHRTLTQSVARVALNAVQWNEGVRLALADFGVRRLPMYLMADRFRPQEFLERVTRNWWRLAQVFELQRLVG